jgi:phosphonopyruvate decarboxylase
VIPPAEFVLALRRAGVTFYSGVPDSLLKDLCAYIDDEMPPGDHVINANEGSAVAIAAGHYLATGEAAAVYLQNSGLGNAVNPLVSLTSRAVYGIPMVLLIGWRGEPGVRDEPQHELQGSITQELLSTLGIGYEVVGPDSADFAEVIARSVERAKEDGCPVALLIRKGTFQKYARSNGDDGGARFDRAQAIQLILDSLDPADVVVSTTGMTSREVFTHREARGEGHGGDFLTVGSMGHASQIALGLALAAPERQVICLDGDGAMIMHLGSATIIGTHAARNLKHILINNAAHDSVGGQPTAALTVDLVGIARACAYESADRVSVSGDLPAAIGRLRQAAGPAFLEVRVASNPAAGAPRPSTTPAENKVAFMRAMGHEP